MKKIFSLFVLIIALFSFSGWVTDSGTTVVSATTPFVVSSIEVTKVLQSNVFTLNYGGSRFGGNASYASFITTGALDFYNYTDDGYPIKLNIGDGIKFKAADDGAFNNRFFSTNGSGYFLFSSPQSYFTGTVSATGVTVTSLNTTSINSSTTFTVTGATSLSGVSIDNVTAQNVTLVSGDYIQAKIAHAIITDGTVTNLNSLSSNVHNVSADNVTTSGFTGSNVDVTKLKVVSGVSADNVTSTGLTVTSAYSSQVSSTTTYAKSAQIGYVSSDTFSVKAAVSVDGSVVFTSTVKIQDLNTGSNAGTALAVDANGRLCVTGKCA